MDKMAIHPPLMPTPARSAARNRRAQGFVLQSPAIALLLAWSVVPLLMTLWYSVRNYNLVDPTQQGFAGLGNYWYLLTDPDFMTSLENTAILVGGVLAISVGLGTLLAVLYNEEFAGRGIARILVISPFFIMPTVAALLWKNLMLHPIYGVYSAMMRAVGLTPIDWLSRYPLATLVMIVTWEWLPFATLILLTAIQSLDTEQKEAARMDGAGMVAQFINITLPHLSRAITVVIMIETIFLLTVFAEISVTTAGGPGVASTNLAFLIYSRALLQFDVGGASAGGVVAIVIANVVAAFLLRAVARNLET
ncbi:carbohydrate ABC transporter permease [Gluconacetobacter entanii]|uniref:carbohydrate ABC transporter permease n=1 Tax=Gluconacetobacter entanii TaxID=108528 RepID=UPI001E284C2D|nr:sugar ABC transporter permease [Gluconacetobacter entanii]MCE2577941.1 sugar ABC transporter permease [Komagataeibacter sp. FNDCR1]MCW4579382.1 sugar ABC transporter permease [Gluconacetobacter entanii]MCW4582777.1 sugar ABC transporter permease [Gluconacetobacter entanii]MCW4586184.1 sugar ABC transporter permease [Gluconacetobacter entanii]